MKRRGPSLDALRQIRAIWPRARSLGWGERSLRRLALSLEPGETLGEVTEGLIEILGGPFRQFHVNHEAAEREAREMLGGGSRRSESWFLAWRKYGCL